MQQEEPFSTNGPSALDDYMAALLRDDSVSGAPDTEDETRLSDKANERQSKAKELNSSSHQTKAASSAYEPSEPKESDLISDQHSLEPANCEKQINEPHPGQSSPAQAALESKTLRLPAEAIPADVALSSVQKHSLQKLLDRQMSAPAPVVESPQAATQTPVIDQAKEGSLDAVGAELLLDATLPCEPESKGSELDESPEPEEFEQAAAGGEQEEAYELTQKSHREHWVNGLPDWGSQRFDVLLFSCRKVNLAIPLISLGHIYLERGSLTQMPSLPAWVMGVKASAAGSLKVIDAGAYFMPERAATLDAEDELHIVSLAGSQWAFAVDTVANPISMNIEDVQWRSQSPQSPWLAGAIKREMCVLIDPPALLFELQRQCGV